MNAAALFNLPVGGSVGTTLRAHLIVYLAQLVVVRLLTSSLCTLVPASNIPDSGSPGAIAHHGELLLERAEPQCGHHRKSHAAICMGMPERLGIAQQLTADLIYEGTATLQHGRRPFDPIDKCL